MPSDESTSHLQGRAVRGTVTKKTQAIAHRGLKASFPENSMVGFRGAVLAGVHAIETDIHLTRDDVVVISHDPSLKRCFGVDTKLIDCDYSYVQTLRTVQEPHVPMPTLKELAALMCEPGAKKMWLLLDIKLDNDPDDVMRLVGEVFRDVGGSAQFWGGRIVLGCWGIKYLPLCEKYLPGFPIVHIGTSIAYARKFLTHPGVGFNLFWGLFQTTNGISFLKEAQAANRNVFVWTVNAEDAMKWAIKTERVRGGCTDDPVGFLELCDGYSKTWEELPPGTMMRNAQMALIRVMWVVVGWLRSRKYGEELKEVPAEVAAVPVC